MPLPEFQKYRRLRTKRDPDEVWLLIRRVDNIGCVVLFCDCITPWIWYCGLADACYEFQLDKTMDRDRHCLRRACPPVFVGPDRRLSPAFIQPGSRRKIVSWV